MRLEAKDREEYLAQVGDRAPELEAVDALIRGKVPHLEPYFLSTPTMSMLGYGQYHYRYASGREGDWPIVALAAQKNNFSLYVSVANDGAYLVETYAKRLGKASCGRSCIRFKKLSDLDRGALEDLLEEAGRLAADRQNLQM